MRATQWCQRNRGATERTAALLLERTKAQAS
jgi:hypothetical protein